MDRIILVIQIVLGVLLVLAILTQQKGAGLGSTFGGELALYRTKRGAEKFIFYITIFLSILFVLFSIAGLVL